MSSKALGGVGLRALLDNLKTQFDGKADLRNGVLASEQTPAIEYDTIKGRPGTSEIQQTMVISLPRDDDVLAGMLVSGDAVEIAALGAIAYRVSDITPTIDLSDSFMSTAEIYETGNHSNILAIQTVVPSVANAIDDFGDAWFWNGILCVLNDNCVLPLAANGVLIERAGLYFVDMPVDDGSITVRGTDFYIRGGVKLHKISYMDLADAPVGRVKTFDKLDIHLPGDLTSVYSFTDDVDGTTCTFYRVGDFIDNAELASSMVTYTYQKDGDITTDDPVPLGMISQDSYYFAAYVPKIVYNILMDGYTVDGITFAQAGLYFVSYEDDVNLQTVFVSKIGHEAQYTDMQLSPTYLPPDRILPEVTSEDNGKILQVVDGAWQVVTMAEAQGAGA